MNKLSTTGLSTTRRNIEAVYPLSPMQQGMLFHTLYAPESGAYFEQLWCTLQGQFNLAAFERAWQQVVNRHSILRTSFVWKRTEQMLQVVHKQVQLPVDSWDWREYSRTEQEEKLKEYLLTERKRGFDLSHAPLVRLGVMRITGEVHYFVLNFHHILLDGWSLPLLLREVIALYEAYNRGQDVIFVYTSLGSARPYRDYINWLQGQNVELAEAYWRRALKGIVASTPLVVDHLVLGDRPPDGGPGEGELRRELEICLSEETTAALQDLARQNRLTLSTMVQSAWALLLSRYSGEREVIFGATVSGRPPELVDVEKMVGLFINTLPVRFAIEPKMPLAAWLQKNHSLSVEMRQFEYSALTQIQEWSEMPPGQPLFESILVFENYPVDASLRQQQSSLLIENVHSNEMTNYPLTVVSGAGKALPLKISYDTGRFEEAAIQRMLGHLGVLLEGFAKKPHLKVGDLSLLSYTEYQEILLSWNKTSCDFPEEICIHQLIEAQSRRTPEALALVYTPQDKGAPLYLTYQELDRRAERLANYLRDLGVGAESVVGISVRRSLEMVVGMLGILKAGGAYVPVDPNYPAERQAFMLEDAGVEVLLTQANLRPRLPVHGGKVLPAAKVVRLDEDWELIEAAPNFRDEVNPIEVTPNHPAYVIYTSGTTGQPKGVIVTHRSLVNHALAMGRAIGLQTGDRMMQFISLSFDASAEEIYPSLVSGATLVLPDPEIEVSGSNILRFCDEQAITIMHLPAPFWHECVDDLHIGGKSVPPALRTLIVGGETPAVDKLAIWARKCLHPMKFLNVYGPTETTITTIYYQAQIGPTVDLPDLTVAGSRPAYDVEDIPGSGWLHDFTQLPIGRPLNNVQVYILDEAMRPLPVGIPGELYIGGVSLALGYRNRSRLTAERFVPNPFNGVEYNATISSSRLYRTGDLARYRTDGQIEFLGRVDQQIKLRGFRIELGEIEAALRKYPGILEAAATLREDRPGDKRLVAYFVQEDSNDRSVVAVGREGRFQENNVSTLEISATALRKFLEASLPDYMLPSTFVQLKALPLSPGGKVDRRNLPAPDGETRLATDSKYVPPVGPVEAILAGIWEHVLGLGVEYNGVVPVSRIGIHDNFFELGGHSLLATQVHSRIRNSLQVDISLREIFEKPTIASLAAYIEAQMRKAGNYGVSTGAEPPPLERLPRHPESGLPLQPPSLSFAQQRLWFLEQLSPGNLFYNLPVAVELSGCLDVSVLQRCLNEVVRRHEVLRTTFHSQGGMPVQVISESSITLPTPKNDLVLVVEDLSSLPEGERQTATRLAAEQEVQQPFDLEKGPLVRARLWRIQVEADGQPERHIFVLTMHHIITDGWSMGIFIQEVAQLYAAYVGVESNSGVGYNGQISPLPELKLQYADYASWQRGWLQGEVLERQLSYWKERLANHPQMLRLPTDHPRPAIQTARGKTAIFTYSFELLESLRKLCRLESVTLYMMLLAAFQTLLYRYSGQEDIIVGTAIANRNHSEIEPLIGFFVNTLPMRTDLSGDPSFKELLKRVREVTLGAYAHQDMPFETLVEALQPERNLSHTPLFQVGFTLQNTPQLALQRSLAEIPQGQASVDGGEQARLAISPIQIDSGSAKFDITLTMAETPQGLTGALEYNLDLFEPATIERMIGHLQTLLQGSVAAPELPISALPMLTQPERRQIVVDWNTTQAETPIHRCAHQLFESQAALRPDAPAVTFEDQTLSYAELDRRANQLAHALHKLGVRNETFVGVVMKRSLEVIVGILGVLKAGGVYLPLDPTYPPDRLAFMLQDAQATVLLTEEQLVERLPLHELDGQANEFGSGSAKAVNTNAAIHLPHILRIDTDWQRLIAIEPATRLESDVRPEHLAYVIYTSGSTGKPKGTLVCHNGLSNLAEAQRRAFGIQEGSRVLQFSPLSFDASVWEIFMALANGGTLCLARQEILASGIDLARLLDEQAITTITLPPSVLRVLPEKEYPTLKTVIVAGETCPADLAERWARGRTEESSTTRRDFFNAYGPTETTVCASMHRINPDAVEYNRAVDDGLPRLGPPIGRPILNTQLYILDERLQLLPVGVPGELCAAGVGLARGYMNRPEMTAQKFIPNLFDSTSATRLYRTGDLARYRPDGQIEFLGRIDQQVKVRGFRIEPGEIEAALLAYPGLKECVVVARDSTGGSEVAAEGLTAPGDTRLVAYIVSDESSAGGQTQSFTPAELRRFLRQSLPDYMIPGMFVALPALPLTPSGKVDRRALPAPEVGRLELQSAYIAPRNPIETQLVEICKGLLGVDRVGVQDNFFELGGHSLLATQFAARVHEAFQVELPLRTFFETPTMEAIAGFIKEKTDQVRKSSTGVAKSLHDREAERARITELVKKIDQLSEAEVAALLEQKRKSSGTVVPGGSGIPDKPS